MCGFSTSKTPFGIKALKKHHTINKEP